MTHWYSASRPISATEFLISSLSLTHSKVSCGLSSFLFLFLVPRNKLPAVFTRLGIGHGGHSRFGYAREASILGFILTDNLPHWAGYKSHKALYPPNH